MQSIKYLFVSFIISLSFTLLAEESPSKLSPGYISDELFIYMHSGAGNNYRIIGSIISGTEIILTGQQLNEYTEIIDDKNRNAWVESKYVSSKPGLRSVIAELNSKLANIQNNGDQTHNKLSIANETVKRLNDEKSQLNNEISELNKKLIETSSKLKDQDTNIKKEWFYNGAAVLVIGLILGLLIPKLAVRRRASMDNWK